MPPCQRQLAPWRGLKASLFDDGHDRRVRAAAALHGVHVFFFTALLAHTTRSRHAERAARPHAGPLKQCSMQAVQRRRAREVVAESYTQSSPRPLAALLPHHRRVPASRPSRGAPAAAAAAAATPLRRALQLCQQHVAVPHDCIHAGCVLGQQPLGHCIGSRVQGPAREGDAAGDAPQETQRWETLARARQLGCRSRAIRLAGRGTAACGAGTPPHGAEMVPDAACQGSPYKDTAPRLVGTGSPAERVKPGR